MSGSIRPLDFNMLSGHSAQMRDLRRLQGINSTAGFCAMRRRLFLQEFNSLSRELKREISLFQRYRTRGFDCRFA
jgi:hypothetical protein